MNTISGAVIDEDVLDWLDNFVSHDQRRIANAINNLAYAHRAELSIPRMFDDEDIAALSHDDLFKILTLASPDVQYDITLSNVQMLGLAMNALNVIDYHLPNYNSPIVVPRKFTDGHNKTVIGCCLTRAEIATAVSNWIAGIRDINMAGAGSVETPTEPGCYLCLDEHQQVRYGRLFKNSGGGWSFIEVYADGKSETWLSTDTEMRNEDDLPMTLLTNWVMVTEWHSANVKAAQEATPIRVSDTQRIFMFLRGLSPHIKAELVAHFKDVFENKPLASVDAIGRLTESEWQMIAEWLANDALMEEGKMSWMEHSAWQCFVAVMGVLDFNFETKQFNPQYEYQANDDEMGEE